MADPTRQDKRGSNGTVSEGVNWRYWILGIAVLLLAIIAIQNWQTVEIRLLFVETNTPLIIGLLIAGALGAVIGYIAPMIRAQKRARDRRAEVE